MTKMMAKKYLAAGFVVFPVGLSYNEEKSTDGKVKKDLAPEPGFTKLTLETAKRLSFTKNAIGLLTGIGVMALDIDNVNLWDHILSDFLETHCELGEEYQVTQADFVAAYQRIHPRTDKGPIKDAMSQKFGKGNH
ncbi:hypothetical protein HK102_013354 [Quaeritorhiza haematococci]|nr:hypothetical protein HK102_013354 [Quaeritorhiza haematococci]